MQTNMNSWAHYSTNTECKFRTSHRHYSYLFWPELVYLELELFRWMRIDLFISTYDAEANTKWIFSPALIFMKSLSKPLIIFLVFTFCPIFLYVGFWIFCIKTWFWLQNCLCFTVFFYFVERKLFWQNIKFLIVLFS